MATEKTIWERKSYSILELLGDVGGLFDCLSLIARNVINPFTLFVLNAEILQKAFRLVDVEKKDNTDNKIDVSNISEPNVS